MKKSIIAVLFTLTSLTQAQMIHRFSFDKDGTDSIGKKNAALNGTAVIADGKLVLDTQGWAAIEGGIVHGLNSAAYELWFDYENSNEYVRIIDFGTTNDQGMGGFCWYFAPQFKDGARTTFANTMPGYNNEELIQCQPLPEKTPVYVAVIYDGEKKQARIFINGQLAGQRDMKITLNDIKDEHVYLGKSSYVPDKMLKGSIDEVRIYNDKLSDLQVILNSQLGPNTLQKCVVSEISPQNSAKIEAKACVLKWECDKTIAVDHFEVAYGKDAKELTEKPNFIKTLAATSSIDSPESKTNYFWRVDTIDKEGKRYVGPVTSFTTN